MGTPRGNWESNNRLAALPSIDNPIVTSRCGLRKKLRAAISGWDSNSKRMYRRRFDSISGCQLVHSRHHVLAAILCVPISFRSFLHKRCISIIGKSLFLWVLTRVMVMPPVTDTPPPTFHSVYGSLKRKVHYFT